MDWLLRPHGLALEWNDGWIDRWMDGWSISPEAGYPLKPYSIQKSREGNRRRHDAAGRLVFFLSARSFSLFTDIDTIREISRPFIPHDS